MDDTLKLILERLKGLEDAVQNNACERREDIAHLHGKVDLLTTDVAIIKGQLSKTPAPGESAICRQHQEVVGDIGKRLDVLKVEVDDLRKSKWMVMGGVAFLLFLFNVLWPVVSKHIWKGP